MAKEPITSQHVAAIVLVAVLGITALALFIWMGANQWSDKTGLSVAIIFILLTIIQGGLSFLWWRAPQRKAGTQDDIDMQGLAST